MKRSSAHTLRGKWMVYFDFLGVPDHHVVDDPYSGLLVSARLTKRTAHEQTYEMLTVSQGVKEGGVTKSLVTYNKNRDALFGKNIDEDGISYIEWQAVRLKR